MSITEVTWWISPERRATAEFESAPVEYEHPDTCLGCAGAVNQSLCEALPICAIDDVIFKQRTRVQLCL